MKLNQLLKKRLQFLVIVLFPMLATAQQFGSIDPSFNIGEGPKNSYAGGAESSVNTIKLAADGNLIVGGQFLNYNNAQKQLLVKITPQGAIAPSFNVPLSINLVYSANNEQTFDLEPLTNGKILVKGFLSDAFEPGSSTRGVDKIYLINSNGTLDQNFTVSGFSYNRSIKNLEVTTDNKVLLVEPTLRRLYSNGINDPSFVINLLPGYRVEVSKILTNGKILVAGSFRTQFGTNENKVYRLLSNGRVDSTFSLSARANGGFRTLTTLANGKILLSGSFTSYNGVAVNNIVRLNADGTNDNTFNIGGSFNSAINSIVELTDGSLIVGGSFTEYNGNPVSGLLKFDADGALVASFNPLVKSLGNGLKVINDVLVLPNGKLVIGGRFNSINGLRANNIGLINPDGSTDLEFNQFQTLAPTIYKVIKEANTGNWIVAGAFDTFNGHKTFGIARVLSNGVVDTTFKHETNHLSTFYTYEHIGGLAVDGNGNIYFSAKGKPLPFSSSIADQFFYSAALRPNGSIIENSIFSSSEDNSNVPWANSILTSTNNSLLYAGVGVGLYSITDNQRIASYATGFTTNGSIAIAQGDYDNKLMIGGNFTEAGGAPNNGVARLATNGQRDNTFSSASGANGTVKLIFPLQGGEYILGGNFDFYSGIQRRGLAKVSNTGILNESFNANAGFQVAGAFPAELNAGVVLPNNQVIVAGNFTRFNGITTNRIICLDQDGNPVSNFQATGADNTIHSIAQNNTGDILVAGDFTTFNNQGANYLVKLFGNGTPLSANVKKGQLPMQVYPNPATDKLTIVSQNGIGSLTITDNQGKQVLTRTMDGDAVISIADLKTGIYTLRLETAQGVAIQKVVKQ